MLTPLHLPLLLLLSLSLSLSSTTINYLSLNQRRTHDPEGTISITKLVALKIFNVHNTIMMIPLTHTHTCPIQYLILYIYIKHLYQNTFSMSIKCHQWLRVRKGRNHAFIFYLFKNSQTIHISHTDTTKPIHKHIEYLIENVKTQQPFLCHQQHQHRYRHSCQNKTKYMQSLFFFSCCCEYVELRQRQVRLKTVCHDKMNICLKKHIERELS